MEISGDRIQNTKEYAYKCLEVHLRNTNNEFNFAKAYAFIDALIKLGVLSQEEEIKWEKEIKNKIFDENHE